MTVLTKQSITVKKMPLITEGLCDEDNVEMQVPSRRKHNAGTVTCMVIAVCLLVLMGFVTAMQIYMQLTSDVVPPSRFKGFCSVPLLKTMKKTVKEHAETLDMLQDLQLESHTMPLRWKSAPVVNYEETDIQVADLLGEDPDHLFDLLREVLDIDIDESVEKISVFNNGHPVTFIHDFESNMTGIVDAERCYMMELDGSSALQPSALVAGLQAGREFSVRRARHTLHALLPPPPARLPSAFDKCAHKPVYHLEKDPALVIRKRSVDAPPHDYMLFAGKGVQEIEISNLAELLEFEQESKLKAQMH